MALSIGMRENIEKRFPGVPVIDVTNAANIPLFSKPAPFENRSILDPKKYAIYTGNIGPVNNSLWLLEAAKILQKEGRTDLKILMIGEGQQREHIEEEISKHQLETLLLWGLDAQRKVGWIDSKCYGLTRSPEGHPRLGYLFPKQIFLNHWLLVFQ